MVKIYPITPVPKPRMTRRDKWQKRPCVERYWRFKDECRLWHVELPEAGASIIFMMPMPKSWSKKKREKMLLWPHQQKPDLSNLLKALEDALYSDDSKIYRYERVAKYWAEEGAIRIVTEDEEANNE